MQTTFETILTKKYLLASLAACTAIILCANLIGEEIAILVGNLLYIPITGSFLVVAILVLARFGTSGYHGIAWVAFAGYAISWFIGEMLWVAQELYFQSDPFPSSSDLFYLAGYPFLFMFFMAYLQPVKGGITKKMVVFASVFSIGILIVGLYAILGQGHEDDLFMTALATSYPVFDSLILIPALIGVVLFFKGKVNFMWTLICFGVLSAFIADAAFLFDQNKDSYYTGNPMEIPFYWNYILLTFGLHSHLVLFQKGKKVNLS